MGRGITFAAHNYSKVGGFAVHSIVGGFAVHSKVGCFAVHSTVGGFAAIYRQYYINI